MTVTPEMDCLMKVLLRNDPITYARAMVRE